jgi:hypothetical protein
VQISKWVGFFFFILCSWVGAGNSQILHPITDSRELYVHAALDCRDGQELRSAPSAPFATFRDTIQVDFQQCTPRDGDWVRAKAEQESNARGDSIGIHEFVESTFLGAHAQVSVARSDVSIGFRIGNGPHYGYAFVVDVDGEAIGGIAVFSASLSGSGVRDTLRVQEGPEMSNRAGFLYRHGSLGPGDYTLEVHARAESFANYSAGKILAIFKLTGPVAVLPTTWGQAKSLYR